MLAAFCLETASTGTTSALRQKAASIYLKNKESRIEERVIKLGLETATELEVLDGLSESDRVMVGSRSQVKPGQKVEVKMLEMKAVE